MNFKFYIIFGLIIIGIFNVANVEGLYFSYRGIGPSTLTDDIEIYNKSYIDDNFPDSVIMNITFYTEYPIVSKDFTIGEYYVVGEKI